MNFCPNCGTKVPNPDDVFCFNCGQKLADTGQGAEAPVPQQARDTARPQASLFEEGQDINGTPITGAEGKAGGSVVEEKIKPPRAAEDKKTAAQRIAQAINGEETPQEAVPAAPTRAPKKNVDLQDLERMIDEEAGQNFGRESLLFEQAADPFAGEAAPAAGQTAEFVFGQEGMPVQEAPAQAGFGDLEQLMEPESETLYGQQMSPQQPMPEEAGGNLFDQDAWPQQDTPTAVPPDNAGFSQLENMMDRQDMGYGQDMYAAEKNPPAQAAASSGRPSWVAQHRENQKRAQQEPAPQKERQVYQTQGYAQGAVEPRRAAPPAPPLPSKRDYMEYEDVPPRRSAGSRVGRVLLVVVLAIVAICATTLTMLYVANRPGKVIDDFAAAVQTQDVQELKSSVALAGGLQSSDEGWAALCAAFENEEDLTVLKNELKQQAGDPGAVANMQYQAVQMKSEPLFLFIKRYHIELQPVSILAPGAGEGTTLFLGTQSYQGTANAQGMEYSGLMPGKYDGSLVVPGGTEPAQTFTVTAFSVSAPNSISSGGPSTAQSATLVIGGCLSDEAALFVSGVQVAEVPVNGVVTIPDVPLGSEIKISLVQDGKQMEASVVFSDINVTNLMFSNYSVVNEGAASGDSPSLSTVEIENIMQVFYTSYLDCINAQSMGPITLCTEANKARLEKRVTSDANKANNFSFVSLKCDEESVTTSTQDGKTVIEFNMTFTYEYWPRDDSSDKQNASNKQSVQLVYEDGQWLVNYMVFVDDTNFAAHKTAEFRAD